MFRLTLLLPSAVLVVVLAGTLVTAAPAPSSFVGSWRMEHRPPGGSPGQGILVITQNGDELAGVMRLERTNVQLTNVRESEGIISFSMRAADAPNVTLNFSGAIRGSDLGVASQDLGNGSYTLTGKRGAAPAQTSIAQNDSAMRPPPPETTSALREPAQTGLPAKAAGRRTSVATQQREPIESGVEESTSVINAKSLERFGLTDPEKAAVDRGLRELEKAE
jgi:hypothetical protein